jgi:hypothetical protein
VIISGNIFSGLDRDAVTQERPRSTNIVLNANIFADLNRHKANTSQETRGAENGN